MKIAKWILIVVGSLVAVFLVGAALITPTYKVERSTTINAPAAKVYALISDPRAWTRWTVWNRLGFVEMNMVSTGALTLTPEGDATRIRWTNEGDVGKNPMMRWFVPFMDSMMGPDFAGGLANLKALAEKS